MLMLPFDLVVTQTQRSGAQRLAPAWALLLLLLQT
ncbi:hypothetical protein ATCR1_06816 [Agrobacterium tumefaciens CCNWGS0286]|nr:hypothetical protein ATCR1_06816 [Agrobacterium tumefaciens CCNWGS0286]